MLRCMLCSGAAALPALCHPCRADIELLKITAPCPRCGMPRQIQNEMQNDADGADSILCPDCIKNPPPLERLFVQYKYQPPLDALVLRCKYGGQWQLSSTLAALMPAPPPADVALPVPLHPARERWRGFNQSRELAKRAGLRPQEGWLTRVVNTTPQVELSGVGARRKNIEGAFAASDAVRGASVLLVDDVMTSGATLWEAARTLKRAGAAGVSALLVARAVV